MFFIILNLCLLVTLCNMWLVKYMYLFKVMEELSSEFFIH